MSFLKPEIPAVVMVFLLIAVSLASGEAPRKGGGPMNMTLESPAFKDGDIIPAKYTCDGDNVSPPLSWSNPPEGTVGFALIMDDPDAPLGTWVHWIVYRIPATARFVAEGASKSKKLPEGSVEGFTDFQSTPYGGPCPPSGTHRYFIKLYALDTRLNLQPGATKKQLLDAMKGHMLAQAELVGKYKRQK